MKAHLPQVNDTKAGKPMIVYAPHCYPAFVDIGGGYTAKYRNQLSKWYHVREQEQVKHQSPILLGEFGLSPDKKGYDAFLRDLNRQADSIHMSWSYWSNSLGGWSPLKQDLTPSPILWELVRAYPQATAGRLVSYSFDQVSRNFQMEYISDAAIAQPTEIAVPSLLYGHGYDLNITGAKDYKTEVDPVTNTLKVFVLANNSDVKISIKPR